MRIETNSNGWLDNPTIIDGRTHVYRGEDQNGRRLVFKVAENATDDRLLEEESALLKGLQLKAGPNPVFKVAPEWIAFDREMDQGGGPGHACLVMSDEGRSLRDLLEDRGPLNEDEVDQLANSLLVLMQHLEKAEVEPLQLNPDHVLIGTAGLDAPVLAGWSAAIGGGRDLAPDERGFPEDPPAHMQSALYLWGLTVLEAGTNTRPQRIGAGTAGWSHPGRENAEFGTNPAAMSSVVRQCTERIPSERPSDATTAQQILAGKSAPISRTMKPKSKPKPKPKDRPFVALQVQIGGFFLERNLGQRAAIQVILYLLAAGLGWGIGSTLSGIVTNA